MEKANKEFLIWAIVIVLIILVGGILFIGSHDYKQSECQKFLKTDEPAGIQMRYNLPYCCSQYNETDALCVKHTAYTPPSAITRITYFFGWR